MKVDNRQGGIKKRIEKFEKGAELGGRGYTRLSRDWASLPS
jgi:hypothetical protein